MADNYLPAPQLPEGLAQELIRQISRKGDAWSGAIQGAGQNIGQGLREYLQRQQQTSTPARLTGLNQSVNAPPPLQNDRQSFTGGVDPNKRLNPNETSFVQDLMMKKLQTQAGQQKLSIPNSDSVKTMYKKAGFDAPTTPSVAKDEFDRVSQIAQSKTKTEGSFILEAWKSAHPSASKTRSTDLQEEKMWEQANRVVNPNSAPRGSLLGTAGLLNARADRALETLKDPKITPQQIQMVVTDIAGIMHGGSPDEVELKSQNYGTYWTSFESLLGKISNSPQEAGSQDTIDKLNEIVKGLKKIDNKIIKNNLDIVENSHSGLIKNDPERWKKIKEQVMSTTQGVTEQSGVSLPSTDEIDAELKKRGGQ